MNVSIVMPNEKANAIREISSFIMAKANECYAKGWCYFTDSDAPETYKALKEHKKSKLIPIASYGSSTSIYGCKEVNEMFRFWHDVVHLELDIDFSKKGESRVAREHIKQGQAYGLSSLALSILHADTKGQIDYYFRHKEFVGNQDAFVDSCLKHGISTAIKVKH